MRRTLILSLIILLLIPLIQAGGVPQTKIATFISKYSTRSMDEQTLDYYQKIEEDYDVYIIEDLQVATNSPQWKTLSQISDLIFLINLNDEVLNETRDSFCKNLAPVLNETVGLIFAGNSVMFEGDENSNISSCLYTKHFDFAGGIRNTGIITDTINITASHPIAQSYSEKLYKLKESGKIHPVVSPKKAIVLAKVTGDPDGYGPFPSGDYPLITLWQGINHNALSFGITTSELTRCFDCLNWDLFEQALNWTSSEENMGYDLTTDKDTYFLDERVEINVESHVEIKDVQGKIIYPDGEAYDLLFFGSGNEWDGLYLFQEDDPPGNYIISTTIEGLNRRKNIDVKAMRINLEIDNSSEPVLINSDFKDKYGREMVVSKADLTIRKPSGNEVSYRFNNTDSLSFLYNVTESGYYVVTVQAEYTFGKSQVKTENFYFKLRPKLEFTPSNMTETVNEKVNLTKSIIIKNLGNETVSDIKPVRGGEIGSWINFNESSFGLDPGNSTQFNFNISMLQSQERVYTGYINFSSENGFNLFPITIELNYLGNLEVTPLSFEEKMTMGDAKEIEFWLENKGKGSLRIDSVTASTGIEKWVEITNQPQFIIANGRVPLRMVLTMDEPLTETFKEVDGTININTESGSYQPSPSVKLKLYSDIATEADSFYPRLIEIEKEVEDLSTKTDVESFEEEIESIRAKIMNTQDLYNNGQLESAYGMYNGIGTELEELKKQVEERESELKEGKRTVIRTVIIIGIIIVVVIVGYKVYKSVRGNMEYGWLYDKWKNR
jgi:hypothetical protein